MLTHPRLAHAIIALRPGLKSLVDFVVQDNGKGPFLVEGTMRDQPTQDQVDAVTEAQLDEAQSNKRGQTDQQKLEAATGMSIDKIRALLATSGVAAVKK